MSDHVMTAGSDAGSVDSFDLAPDSPLTREKTRAAHASWILELEQKPEFKLLNTFLQQPDVAQDEAIHQLVDLTHRSALEEEIGNHCWMTACSFLEMAARTAPEQQSRLIDLLLSLRSVVLTDPSTNEPWTFEDGAGIVWQDLPTVGYSIADEMGSFGKFSRCSTLNLALTDRDGQEQTYTQEESQKWENLTAFLAQIDSNASSSGSVLESSASWALTAFTWAFEGGGNSGEPSELAVRLACIWLVYDADKLWSKASDVEAKSNTHERWNVWRHSLAGAQTRFTNGTTPTLIAHALAQMQRVQDSN